MIECKEGVFALHTRSTSYIFRITETGHPEHLYYGKKIRISENASFLGEERAFAPGNSTVYDKDHKGFSLEDVCLEFSGAGKGDLREPFIQTLHYDGASTDDFLFAGWEKRSGAIPEKAGGLPRAYDESGKAETLITRYRDSQYDLELELLYTVFPECDVITRTARLRNGSKKKVRLLRLFSNQVDFPDSGYIFHSFNGAWAREMAKSDIPLIAGKHVNSSRGGTSGSRANPFVMLSRPGTSENAGEVYGFNLIYSGNHYESAEISAFGKLRFSQGIDPETFGWELDVNEVFETPEAVMSFSAEGFNGLSGHMHAFVRESVVRGKWKKRPRPVLLNTWEAYYFDINERRVLAAAREAKKLGIEMIVVDDGWFAGRKDDARALGDWTVNTSKFPGGFQGLSEKLGEMGMELGIWVEPEMVNVDSQLYKDHPEWTVSIPGRPHSEGRNQRILDLADRNVQEFIIDSVSALLQDGSVRYVKWDMNRNFSDYYSPSLPKSRQREAAHRYILGLYQVMGELTKRFPEVLFEGCASGGNRFDLGILSYFPQIWASDNTDALSRAEIQTGLSYGYPPSVWSSHISDVPNHQTQRRTPMESRFAAALFGIMGYECDLRDLLPKEKEEIKEQIRFYKDIREMVMTGSFFRGRSFTGGEAGAGYGAAGLPGSGMPAGSVLRPSHGNVTEWTLVSRDRKKAVGMLMQKLTVPNVSRQVFRAKGLDPDKLYHFTSRPLSNDIREFGSLVNTVTPAAIHIKKNSQVLHAASRFIRLKSEEEDHLVYGDALMHAGVTLQEGFAAVGYQDGIRFFPDFAARVYLMEEEEE